MAARRTSPRPTSKVAGSAHSQYAAVASIPAARASQCRDWPIVLLGDPERRAHHRDAAVVDRPKAVPRPRAGASGQARLRRCRKQRCGKVEQSRDDQRELHHETFGRRDEVVSMRSRSDVARSGMPYGKLARRRIHYHGLLLIPYELLVGLRYFRARRGSSRNGFVSFIAAVSMAGIALGVAALIVVISVMNGFQEELRNRILAVASHIEIRAIGPGMGDWQDVARQAKVERARARRGAVRLRARRCCPRVAPIAVRSCAASIRRSRIPSPMSASTCAPGSLADLKPGEFGIVLGSELARALGVRRRRYGRRDHAAGDGDARGNLAAGEELQARRRVRDRHVRIR